MDDSFRFTVFPFDGLSAVDGTLHDELTQLFPVLQAEREARCIVLTGSGKAFSAGGGRFARIVYAPSPAEEIDASLASVERAMERAMTSTDWTVMRSTHHNMVHLGVPEDIER